jgi:uncharacterized protein
MGGTAACGAPGARAEVLAGASPPGKALPILDMHLHALGAADQGPPPLAFCLPVTGYPVVLHGSRWPEAFLKFQKQPTCADPIWSGATDEEIMERTLAIMRRRNVIGVTSGPQIERWRSAAPERIIPGLFFAGGPDAPSVEEVRSWFESGRFTVLGEVTIQYGGMEPGSAGFAPYAALAEELDVPVGIHIGTGPPGAPYLGFDRNRARLHSPLLIEELLVRHPRLRVYLMHAGWPMLDDLLAVLWTHPQVHVDVGVISFALPRAAFHDYLRRIVEAGFGNRVLFGSDQMVWPEALEHAIEAIETASFLTPEQKRDILYDNAARFLRLPAKEIARHHAARPAEAPRR